MPAQRIRQARPAAELSGSAPGSAARVSLRALARQPLAQRAAALRGMRVEVDSAETELWDATSGDSLDEDASTA